MNAVVPIAPPQDTAALLQVIERAATNPDVDIDKMERLMMMHERIVQRNGETAFNDALTACQSEMRPIAADAYNTQTKSKYPTYNALYKALRPIYTKHGFSISYDTGDSLKTDHVKVLAYVARSSYTRTYKVDMPADGKGAKGGDVMTKTHASGAANSYGMRYLLKMIFNVSIGEDDNDGNDDAEHLGEGQIADLMALAEEVKADRVKFLKYMGVEKLADIQTKDYSRAVKALEAKRNKP